VFIDIANNDESHRQLETKDFRESRAMPTPTHTANFKRPIRRAALIPQATREGKNVKAMPR
jgi:hypothetical protein